MKKSGWVIYGAPEDARARACARVEGAIVLPTSGGKLELHLLRQTPLTAGCQSPKSKVTKSGELEGQMPSREKLGGERRKVEQKGGGGRVERWRQEEPGERFVGGAVGELTFNDWL